MAGGRKNSADAVGVQKPLQKYSKEQLAASAKYRHHRDLVEALLEREKKYTTAAVDKMIENYMKGKVK